MSIVWVWHTGFARNARKVRNIRLLVLPRAGALAARDARNARPVLDVTGKVS